MKKTALGLTILVLIGLIMCPIEASAQITHPSPSYDYAPLTPRVGDTVTFDASIFMARWKESTIVSLDWNFVDGTTQTGTVVEHKFAKPGEYWVELAATDSRGMTASTAHLVIVAEQTPITVYQFLSSERVYIGQELTISGNLIFNGEGVPDELISFSTKTYADNAEWIQIGVVKTDKDGKYSFIWQSNEPRGYQVRARWAANATYPETSLSRILYVNSYGDLITGFSSNSTITEMNFNMTTRLLTFRAQGPSATSGYVNVTLENDPSFNPQNIIVQLDNQPIQYTVESTNQSWNLYFIYTHSIHNIMVDFTGNSIEIKNPSSPTLLIDGPAPEQFPATTLTAVSAAIILIIAGASLLIYFKKIKRKAIGAAY
jgi:hypothetical protein